MAEGESFKYKKLTLHNQVEMPIIGLGTFRIRKGVEIKKAVDYALNAGYRLFDTASVYGNEIHLKDAFKSLLPKYGLEREDIFITTKLAPSDHGSFKVVEKAFEKSLDKLGLDYVDLYLIHFPGTATLHVTDERNKILRQITWNSMEKLYDEGRVKAVGVSNFTLRHLKDLLANQNTLIPTVNQVEWHPFYYQPELLQYCKEKDIVMQAYCSLGGASSSNCELLRNPIVKMIAKKLQVTTAQVLLRWAVQQGLGVIPKSTNQERITKNISLDFTIPEEDMTLLNTLGERNIKYAWNPNDVF